MIRFDFFIIHVFYVFSRHTLDKEMILIVSEETILLRCSYAIENL